MLTLFLVIAVLQRFSASRPVPDLETPQSGPALLGDHRIRTRFDIVWSCVATLFICTWVAIHPNIPPRGIGRIRLLWRRIELMLWTLVVPELILIWAYRQWVAARYIAACFQKEGWTPAHAHFLIMGGFIYVDDDGERVVDFDYFLQLLGLSDDPPQIGFPMITAEEIHDKARGDFLSKAIVILQGLWFIVQCIARGKQGLAVTELELVTLALASLNGVMYYFWWDKPLGVNEPVRLYARYKGIREKLIEGGWDASISKFFNVLNVYQSIQERDPRIRPSSRGSLVQRLVRPLQELRSPVKEFRSGLSACHARLSSIPESIKQIIINRRKDLLEEWDLPGVTYLWSLYLPIMLLIADPLLMLSNALLGIARTKKLNSQSNHVPTFYAPHTPSVDIDFILFFVLPPIAVLFGGLHCIAWNFQFPTPIEQLLWRIGSLTITLIPAVPFLLIFLVGVPLVLYDCLDFRISLRLPRAIEDLMEVMIVMFATLCISLIGAALVAYMLARLLLLTQAAVLLRAQPESAFYAIDWAHFLPHL